MSVSQLASADVDTAETASTIASADDASSRFSLWKLFPKTDKVDPARAALLIPSNVLLHIAALSGLSYECFSLLRQWSGRMRDDFCPPSSYSRHSRSSHTLIDASASFGYVSIAMIRRPDVYHRVIACQCDTDYCNAISNNRDLYGLTNSIHIKTMRFLHYYNNQYATESKYAVVYWDVDAPEPTENALTLNSSNDDYSFPQSIPQTGSTLLSVLLVFLLSHPDHPVPMIILKLPLLFDIKHYKQLARNYAEELRIARPAPYKFIILAGHKQQETETATSAQHTHTLNTQQQRKWSHVQEGQSVIVLASSHSQLLFLYSARSSPSLAHLYQRLKQIMQSQLYGCPNAQKMLCDEFNRLMSTGHKDDENLYDLLRSYYHDTLLQLPECVEIKARKASALYGCSTAAGGGVEDGRANSRVKELVQLIRTHSLSSSSGFSFPPPNFLDVGCSEGSITASLAKALDMKPHTVHGCDVRELPTSNLFTFTLITDTNLPYPDQQFHCILALMSLHHIETVEKTLIEMYRVCAPGGLVLIREHDLNVPELSVLIDVMHGLYARTWSNPPEQPMFCDDYYAHYRSRQDWTQMIEKAGFRQCRGSPDREKQHWDQQPQTAAQSNTQQRYIKNPFQFYYGLYEKPIVKPSTVIISNSTSSRKRGRNDDEEEKEGEGSNQEAQSRSKKQTMDSSRLV